MSSFQRQLNARIHKLKTQPVPADSEAIEGALHRLRIERWRVLYEVDDDARVITILAIVGP